MSYIIIDKTANTGAIYIDHEGENCNLEENAFILESFKDAVTWLDTKFKSWDKWAVIIEQP
jgi:hypothetical protein